MDNDPPVGTALLRDQWRPGAGIATNRHIAVATPNLSIQADRKLEPVDRVVQQLDVRLHRIGSTGNQVDAHVASDR